MISRRKFIKLTGLAMGALIFPKWSSDILQPQQQIPSAERLGRICAGEAGAQFEVKSEPYWNAPSTGIVWRDEVVEWKRDVVAKQLDYNRYNQKWVETPKGYIYGAYVQPVKNIVNQPLTEFPLLPNGERGLWVEISAPVVDLIPATTPSSYWIRETLKPRIYYSQIFWAYDIRNMDGKTEYLLMEKYGAVPDNYWVDATTCRPITTDEIAPINPDNGDKKIKVDLNYQTLSCYEGNREVYFCEVSSGGIVDGKWLTPRGVHTIWRKMISTHMSASGVFGFDAPGIGWTTLFDPNGAAIHSAYWHNNFGTALSHGCLNCRPDDAKWIWRWTLPEVNYLPGELTIQGLSKSTTVDIVE
ncbi:MAG: L,D-transpeptidase [Anaerolineaceae bacterium]|nr:L,D-transpeptidase [Anaerolineaceae bacterium]